MEKKLANFLTGWSYEDVLPFFKISEDNRDYQIAKNTRFDSMLKTRGIRRYVKSPNEESPGVPTWRASLTLTNCSQKLFKAGYYILVDFSFIELMSHF